MDKQKKLSCNRTISVVFVAFHIFSGLNHRTLWVGIPATISLLVIFEFLLPIALILWLAS